MDTQTSRWAGRLMLLLYAAGFLSAVAIMVVQMGRKMYEWVRKNGGW